MTAPGWYVDPGDTTVERYWDGSRWQVGAVRARRPANPEPFTPTAPTAAAHRSAEPDQFTADSRWMYTLAVIVGLGAVVGGIVLAVHSVPICTVNPYDTSLSDCTGKSHPFVAAGIGLIVGGLIQSAVFTIVGRLCAAVAVLRTAAARP